MKSMLFRSVAVAALMIPGAAFAQSTGTIETDEGTAADIVVTGSRNRGGVNGIEVPDSTKARAVINQDLIERQAPGQTIINTINLVPGVNFTNSDAYGSSGGNLRIRGFDGNRISLTFDGFPLNDTGNYAIYSNQQLDPELIESVNVNLGTTDVDSPTASAAGGTVNYRTILPSRDLSARLAASVGDNNYYRVFGMISPGEITPLGTRLFVAASYATNDKFKGPGEINKQQYNARIYQPIGDNGDFMSIAGHYNENRNNFYRNPSVSDLRTLFGTGTVPLATGGFSSANPLNLGNLTDAQQRALFFFENDPLCRRPTPTFGTAQNDGATGFSCSNFYEVRINPSNTGNVRFNSRFTLADNLIFTADASWQYVLANGGGYTTLAENSALARGRSGLAGVDFNRDGDFLDTVSFFTPNNTNTRRYSAIMSLIWDASDNHRFQLSYTFDHGRHRQTGEWGYLDAAGRPLDVFGGRNSGGVFNADGFKLQQRDRLSYAMLNQVSGRYVGTFMDERLRLELGLRAPFFNRELNNYCYTQATGSGFATCTSQNTGLVIVPPTAVAPFPAGALFAPFRSEYNFNALLPSAGFNYKFTDALSMFGSYARGFSAPRTDNLYRQPVVTIEPETTDAFDLGLRYATGTVQAQLSGWLINYQNRIITSFDPVAGISVDRNVGRVRGYGVDAGLAFRPVRALTLYANASYNNSTLRDDVLIGTATSAGSTLNVFAPTAGKRVAETPEWTVGGRAQLDLDPFSFGIQGKRVSSRFATDVNDVVTPAYTTFDADMRVSLRRWGLNRTYFQLNVYNLFDEFYFGNISTQVNAANIGVTFPNGTVVTPNNGANPNFAIGSPRTIMATLNFGF